MSTRNEMGLMVFLIFVCKLHIVNWRLRCFFFFTLDVTLSAFVVACVVGRGGAMEVWFECGEEG